MFIRRIVEILNKTPMWRSSCAIQARKYGSLVDRAIVKKFNLKLRRYTRENYLEM